MRSRGANALGAGLLVRKKTSLTTNPAFSFKLLARSHAPLQRNTSLLGDTRGHKYCNHRYKNIVANLRAEDMEGRSLSSEAILMKHTLGFPI